MPRRVARLRVNLELGSTILERPIVGIVEGRGGGTIGASLLRHFRVVLDLAHGTYCLEGGPPRLGFAPIAGTGAYLYFHRDEQALLVDGVLPGSPAERAGLRKGDRVLSINGTDPGIENLSALAHLARTVGPPMRLVVQRGADTLPIEVPVVEVVP